MANSIEGFRRLSLGEGRQLYQVVVGHWLQRLTSLLPRRHAAYDDERVESLFSQLQRHPGAGRFARSSAVEIYILFFGKKFEFFGKVVGFNAHRSFDALSVGIVVAMAAYVENQNFFFFVRS